MGIEFQDDSGEVLLNLRTGQERKYIVIDARRYELQCRQDFQLKEMLWLEEQGKRLEGMGPGAYDAAKLAELDKTLNEIVRKIVRTKMPRRILRKLDYAQKFAIMNAFTQAAGIRGETARSERQNGENSSRDSSASMVAH